MHDDQQAVVDLDKEKIRIEMEQGASMTAGKMQNALLKQSLPQVHCIYNGQAARHINTVGSEFIICVNSDHLVDVFRRG